MKRSIYPTRIRQIFAFSVVFFAATFCWQSGASDRVAQELVSQDQLARFPTVAQVQSSPIPVPDFSAYKNINKRKQAFYRYLLPMIRKANSDVMRQRRWLFSVAMDLVNERSLSVVQLKGLVTLEQRYGVKPEGDLVRQVGTLLQHVDVVPASLVLAQAAKESGWGTSRFAVEGNNFFGIWCFSNGCGIRPARREAGLTHEVAKFDSVADGVRYYIRTLNSQSAYGELRTIRAKARRQNQMAPGYELAQGLVRYSARGVDYVNEITTMIRYNKLHRFNQLHQAV